MSMTFLPSSQLCKHLQIKTRWLVLYFQSFSTKDSTFILEVLPVQGHETAFQKLTSQLFLIPWLDPKAALSPMQNEADNNHPLIF